MPCLFHFCEVDAGCELQQGVRFGGRCKVPAGARSSSASAPSAGGTAFRLGTMKSVLEGFATKLSAHWCEGKEMKDQAVSG